jgi:hypothetical protein
MPTRAARPKRHAACVVEILESRRLLSADVWTGSAGNGLFSDGGNWQGGAAPTSGQDVTFPSNTSAATIKVGSAVQVGTIDLDGTYVFLPLSDSSTDSVTITSGITVAAGVTERFACGLIPGGFSSEVNVGAGSVLQLEALNQSGSVPIVAQLGPGEVSISGGDDSGTWQLSGGSLLTTGNLELGVMSDGGTYTGIGSIGALDSGGTLSLANGSNPVVLDSAYNTYFDGGNADFIINATRADPNSPGTTQWSEITHEFNNFSFNQSTALNLTLGSGYVHHPGDVITLVHNTGLPITGTFAGQPEGSTVTADGYQFKISYVGGTTGHDITLTSLGLTPTITLESSAVQTNGSVTLTANVTGTGAAPTGTVEFYEDGQIVGAVEVLSSGTVTQQTTALAAGAHTFTATYSGDSSYYSEQATPVQLTVVATTPTIVDPASAAANAGGKSYALSVLGADTAPAGESGLSYDWTVLSKPAGAASPNFSQNDTNAARSAVVTFSSAGSYVLQCKVSNLAGNFITSDTTINIAQVATALQLGATTGRVHLDHKDALKAVLLDQFGHTMAYAKHARFKLVRGQGKLTAKGVFIPTAKKTTIVRATLAGLTANLKLHILS